MTGFIGHTNFPQIDLGKLAEKKHPVTATPETNAPGWVSVVLAASLLLIASLTFVSWKDEANRKLATPESGAVIASADSTAARSRPEPKTPAPVSTKSRVLLAKRNRTSHSRLGSMTLFGPSHAARPTFEARPDRNTASRSSTIRLSKVVGLEPTFNGKYRSPDAQSQKLAKSWQRWQELKNKTRPSQKLIQKLKRRS